MNKVINKNMKKIKCVRCGYKEYTYNYYNTEYTCSLRCSNRPLTDEEKEQ